jgi:hypothetical protein
MPANIFFLHASNAAWSQAAISHDAWPTTLRFSRHLGEAVRDAEYAAAIEGPDGRPARQTKPAGAIVRRVKKVIACLRASRPARVR